MHGCKVQDISVVQQLLFGLTAACDAHVIVETVSTHEIQLLQIHNHSIQLEFCSTRHIGSLAPVQ